MKKTAARKGMSCFLVINLVCLLLAGCGADGSVKGDPVDSAVGSEEGPSSVEDDPSDSQGSLEGDLNGDGQVNIMDNPAYSPLGRQVLTVAISTMSRQDLDWITDYNASSPSYFIEMRDYGSGVDSFETLETQLALEVLSGEGPDLVMWGSFNYSPSLASARLMEDLNKFMDADPDFHREDYFENILEAFELNGGLYVFPVSFGVSTGSVRAEEFEAGRGVTESWTLGEMIETYENRTLATFFASNFTKEYQLYFLCEDCMGNFVDWSSGECYFDAPEFVELLEWCNTFPEQFQDDIYEGGPYLEALKDGKIFWRDGSAGPLGIAYDRIQSGDARLLWPGHPVPDGEKDLGGGVADPSAVSLSICKNSDNREAAWDFIKSWLTEDMQREMPGFPLLRSVFEEEMQEAMTIEYETVDGVEQEKPKIEINTVIAEKPGGVIEWETTSVYYATEEDVEIARSIIENTHRSSGREPIILDIIMEEAGAYFAGDKDAAAVADIIQHRVGVYVSEHMD